MGTYALFRDIDATGNSADRYWQVVSSMVKVPALYLLTLLVTFPSLYVFNALVGSRLKLMAMLRLLIASLAVNLAVLASMGPIVAFFSVSTTSYRFMQLFDVLVFAGAGILGVGFLAQSLNRMSRADAALAPVPAAQPSATSPMLVDGSAQPPMVTEESPTHGSDDSLATSLPTESSLPGALDRIEGIGISSHVKFVFRIWMVVFGLVGAQMGWVLRPFIGDPQQPFTWFRQRESNFFQALGKIVFDLFQGNG
jgi:hypothetical protein